MSITAVRRDPEALHMTIDTEWDAPIGRVWQLWSDPRQLERWWGPPNYPATVVDHDLAPTGRVTYFMTGPDGDRFHGWWRVLEVDEPHRLAFEDGFGDDAGNPDPAMPTTTTRVTLAEQAGGATRMAIETTFPSAHAMDQLLAMGMEEGITAAIWQIEALLHADVPSP